MDERNPRRLTGKGISMHPLLRGGDGLKVIPYTDRRVCVGDVVVFRSPDPKMREVVHRVVSVDSQGIRTRGDNNNHLDSWILQPEDIIGRVVSAKRADRIFAVHGGFRGTIIARKIRVKKRIDRIISGIRRILYKILHPVYRRLSQSGIFRNILPRQCKPRILCFKRPEGTEMQLLIHNRIIGRRCPGWEDWQIRRPFRLFIDEESLPRQSSDL